MSIKTDIIRSRTDAKIRKELMAKISNLRCFEIRFDIL